MTIEESCSRESICKISVFFLGNFPKKRWNLFDSRLISPQTSLCDMSDKEEYIESSISLEGKYPRFLLDGDKKEDILIRFEEECPCKVVLSSEAEEDIGGALEIHLSEVSGKLSALKFVGGAQRWKLERCANFVVVGQLDWVLSQRIAKNLFFWIGLADPLLLKSESSL